MATPSVEELRDEQRRIRRVQIIVDFTTSILLQSGLSRREGEELVAAARDRILDLFPGREDTYEILYSRRFARLLDSCTAPEPEESRGRPRPFRPAD